MATTATKPYVAFLSQSGIKTTVPDQGTEAQTIEHFRNGYLSLNYGCDVSLCRPRGMGVLEILDARSVPLAANGR